MGDAAFDLAMDYLARCEAGCGAREPYRSASRTDRTLRNWLPGHYSADSAILSQLDTLLARARDEGRNSPLSLAVVQTLDKHVVATGIGCKANAQDNTGEDLQDFNDEVDRLWLRYAARHVDYVSRSSFAELQSLCFREIVESGQVFLLEVIDARLPYGVAFEMLEKEQLDTSQDRPRGVGQNEIRGGIEIDRAGRPVAYYVLDEHPYGQNSVLETSPRRIPATQIIDVFRRQRFGQVHGVSWLAPLLQNSRDFNGLLGSELQAARLASLFTVLIKREQGAGTGLGLEADDFDDPLSNYQLGSGIISDLGRYDDVKIIENQRPSQQIKDFSELLFLVQGMAAGVSYLAITGDYSAVNYSSARAALNDDKKLYRQLQAWYFRALVEEVYRRWLRVQVIAGRVTSVRAQEFKVDPERWLAADPVYPGWEQIDELKETNAAAMRIALGLSTLEIETARLGRDWHALLKQRAREIEFAKSLGLDLPTHSGVTAQAEPAVEE